MVQRCAGALKNFDLEGRCIIVSDFVRVLALIPALEDGCEGYEQGCKCERCESRELGAAQVVSMPCRCADSVDYDGVCAKCKRPVGASRQLAEAA